MGEEPLTLQPKNAPVSPLWRALAEDELNALVVQLVREDGPLSTSAPGVEPARWELVSLAVARSRNTLASGRVLRDLPESDLLAVALGARAMGQVGRDDEHMRLLHASFEIICSVNGSRRLTAVSGGVFGLGLRAMAVRSAIQLINGDDFDVVVGGLIAFVESVAGDLSPRWRTKALGYLSSEIRDLSLLGSVPSAAAHDLVARLPTLFAVPETGKAPSSRATSATARLVAPLRSRPRGRSDDRLFSQEARGKLQGAIKSRKVDSVNEVLAEAAPRLQAELLRQLPTILRYQVPPQAALALTPATQTAFDRIKRALLSARSFQLDRTPAEMRRRRDREVSVRRAGEELQRLVNQFADHVPYREWLAYSRWLQKQYPAARTHLKQLSNAAGAAGMRARLNLAAIAAEGEGSGVALTTLRNLATSSVIPVDVARVALRWSLELGEYPAAHGFAEMVRLPLATLWSGVGRIGADCEAGDDPRWSRLTQALHAIGAIDTDDDSLSSNGAAAAPTRQEPRSIADLATFGVPPGAIEGWRRLFDRAAGESRQDYPLTDLQSAALGHPGTLDSSTNVLITAPTSSGKTLVAQAIAATRLASRPRAKVLYLVPLRALVTEKTADFSDALPNLRVVPVSSDYPASNRAIANGEWDVGVLVFDAMFRWLADPRRLETLLRDVDVVFADELQILEHHIRGEKLEVVLAFFLWLRRQRVQNGREARPKLVGLTAGDVPPSGLADWLDATVIPDRTTVRPVPLVEGWVSPEGEAALFADASKRVALDPASCPVSLRDLLDLQIPQVQRSDQLGEELVKEFVARGLHVLVYVASTKRAELVSQRLARCLNGAPGLDFATQLSTLEDSAVVRLLRQTLARGVACHHGDMTRLERTLVERAFRAPEQPYANVLVATPTLGMGINTPADVVVLFDHYTYGGRASGEEIETGSQRALSVLEYRNYAGRAGRLRPGKGEDAFGLALLLRAGKVERTSTPPYHFRLDNLGVLESLLHGAVRPLRPQLLAPAYGIGPHVLTLLAALQSIDSESDPRRLLRDVLGSTYAGQSSHRARLLESASETINELQKHRVVTSEGRLRGPGNAAAGHHLSTASMLRLLDLSRQLPDLWPEAHLEVLTTIVALDEFDRDYPASKDVGAEPDELATTSEAIRRYAVVRPLGKMTDTNPLARLSSGAVARSSRELRVAIRSLVLWSWARGSLFSRLQKSMAFPGLTLGRLQDLADHVASVLEALRDIYEQTHAGEDDVRSDLAPHIWAFGQSIRFGLPPEVALLPTGLAYASDSGEQLNRKSWMNLWLATGQRRDARELLGMEQPPSVDGRVWDCAQKSARWWKDLAEADQEDRSTSSAAIAESANGHLGWLLAPAGTGVTDAAFRALLQEVEDQAVAYGTELTSVRLVVESALAQSPFNATLSAQPFATPDQPYWSAAIGGRFYDVFLLPGTPTVKLIRRIRPSAGAYGAVIVCGEFPSEAVLRSLPDERWQGVAMSAEALLMGSRLCEVDVSLRPRLLAVLDAVGARFPDTSSMLSALTSQVAGSEQMR